MLLLRSILFIDPFIILCTILMGTVSLVTSLFDKTGDTQHRVARVWSRLLLAASGVRVRLYGLEKLDPASSYILVSNHQSLMDTPLVMGSIPLQFRFFAKEGLFHIPFLGWHLRRAGHLPVVRNNPRASLHIVHEAARMMQAHRLSILVFPEGGRTPDHMREFKEGAAYLAIKAGVPVVPLGIRGTRAVLPMGSVRFRPGPVELYVGDAIQTKGMRLLDRERLTKLLEDKVAELSRDR